MSAQQQAMAALYAMTMRQASILSFIQIFRLMGVMWLVMLPLVFILRRPRHAAPAAAHAVAE